VIGHLITFCKRCIAFRLYASCPCCDRAPPDGC